MVLRGKSSGAVNVRWDEVVTRPSSLSMGTGVKRMAATEAAASDQPFQIRVRLFGMLVRAGVTNPVVLQFAQGCTLRDVINELGRRTGPDLLRHLVSDNGESLNTCRMFLDGEPVQDLTTAILPKPSGATVEIILFRQIEGG